MSGKVALSEVVHIDSILYTQWTQVNGHWPLCFVLLFGGQIVCGFDDPAPFQDRTFVFELYNQFHNFCNNLQVFSSSANTQNQVRVNSLGEKQKQKQKHIATSVDKLL